MADLYDLVRLTHHGDEHVDENKCRGDAIGGEEEQSGGVHKVVLLLYVQFEALDPVWVQTEQREKQVHASLTYAETTTNSQNQFKFIAN